VVCSLVVLTRAVVIAAIDSAWAVTRTPVAAEFVAAVRREMTGEVARTKYALLFHELSMRAQILRAHARLRRASGVEVLSGSELRARFIKRAKDVMGAELAASAVDAAGDEGTTSLELSRTVGWPARDPTNPNYIPGVERALRYIRNTTIDSSIVFNINRLLTPPPEAELVEYVVQRPEDEDSRHERIEREVDGAYGHVGELDVLGDGVRAYTDIVADRPAEGRTIRFLRKLRRNEEDLDPRPPHKRPDRSVLATSGSLSLPVLPKITN
jgi:hypothetical protein